MDITKIEEAFRKQVKQNILGEQAGLEGLAEVDPYPYQNMHDTNENLLKAVPTASIGELFGIMGKLAFDCPSAIGLFIQSLLSDPDDFAEVGIDAIPLHWDT